MRNQGNTESGCTEWDGRGLSSFAAVDVGGVSVHSRSPSLWRGARVVKRDAGLLAQGAAKSIYGFAYSYLNFEGAVHDAIVP